jgi:oligopeptide transport system substrate-binding protein
LPALRAALLLAGLSLIGACAPSLPADLTVALDAEPQSLDPAFMTGVGEGRIAAALFEGLTRLHPETLEVLPGVAHRHEISADGLTWTFHLREDAAWSDGNPLSAEDFRWSWLRLLHPDCPAAYGNLLFEVVGAKEFKEGRAPEGTVGLFAPDAHTLEVRLIRPVPYFGALAAFFTLLPVPRQAVEKHGEHWTRADHIVTNGPYLLRRWSFYREIILEKNPRYWDADRVELHRLRLMPVVDPNTQFNLYETGDVDLLFSVPSPILEHLLDRPDFIHTRRLATAFLRLNVTRKPFDDVRVRQAFALAVDRKVIAERITRGGEEPTGSLVPPGLPGYDPASGFSSDPDRARRLFAEAGYPGGRGFPPVVLLYRDNPDQAALATVLMERYRKVLGVDLRLDSREWKVYISSMKRLEYDLVFGQWIGDYPDPSTFLDCFRSGSGNNRTGWASAVYDRTLDRAGTVLPGETPAEHARRRLRLFREAETLLLTEGTPIIPLYHPTARFMVSPRVTGFATNLLGLVQFDALGTEGER